MLPPTLFETTPPEAPTPAAVVAPAPTRSIWIAPTYQLLATGAFEPSSRHGLGLRGTYEFHVSPRLNLGLQLAYRLYPGAQATQQLGYGVTLKHFFSPSWASSDGVYPFLDYGLLIQQSFIQGRSGNAVSHDTRLAAGVAWRLAPGMFFVDLAGHYSRLSYFDRESIAIPYLEVGLGWLVTF